MGLFDDLADLASKVHVVDPYGWEDATATFTGVSVDEYNNILDGSEGVPSYAYEIRYQTSWGQDVTAWYTFDDKSSPDPRKLAGTTIKIQYSEKDPELFKDVK